MVWNSNVVVRVAEVSAEMWQAVACNPERLSREQVLDLICCFPLHQLGRLLLSLWTYLCYDPSPYNPFYLSSSSSSSGLDTDSDVATDSDSESPPLDHPQNHSHLD